ILRLYAGKIFDSEARTLLSNRVITISADSGLIISVSEYDPLAFQLGGNDIDLRDATVLPGFVDAHVHFFLHAYAETRWDDQVTRESQAERIIRATMHARKTLLAGYTTVRDLGTEGAGDADIALRKCLSGPDPIIPGPRYFCANRALISTGSYGPKSSLHPDKEGADGVTGAEVVDGVDECKKAVRRQVGAGADWIKVGLVLLYYHGIRSRMANAAPLVAASTTPTFDREELQAILLEASRLGVKVAAHASDWNHVGSLPFHTLEHGDESLPPPGSEGDSESDADLAQRWKGRESCRSKSTTWVPTLSVYRISGGKRWTNALRTFRAALAAGFDNIACGGDTGPFPHGDNSLELRLMVEAGAPWDKVLSWATYGGWKCVRPLTWEGRRGKARLASVDALEEDPRVVGDNEVPFGVLRQGFAADIIATTGDLEKDFANAVDKNSISFVMKGGKVYKRDGKEV
ncbi:hypothetical protein K488DRAFT_38875, partial [Vararia minispora EC-137]